MDDLRLMLILVGSFAIIAVLIHGFWMNKKEKSSIFNQKDEEKPHRHDMREMDDELTRHTQFDDLFDQSVQPNETSTPSIAITNQDEPYQDNALYTISPEYAPHVDDTVQVHESTTPVVEDKSSMASTPAQTQRASMISSVELTETMPSSSSAASTAETPHTARVQTASIQQPTAASAQVADQASSKKKKEDIIVLHVASMYGGDLLKGSLLYPSILNAGFRFGEMEIFHRHIDVTGDGSVLFSLANMVKPGTLHPENMPYLETPGVTIFMAVPSYGDSLQNFKLMLQLVQQIADDVDGRVLDEERHMITPQKIDAYKERIRQVLKHNEQVDAAQK